MKLISLRKRLTEYYLTQEKRNFMRTSQKSITEQCRILTCSLEARHAKAGQYAGLRKGFEDDRGNMFLEYIRIHLSQKTQVFCG